MRDEDEVKKYLYFVIRDDGQGMEWQQLDSLRSQFIDSGAANSIGLANVYRRLMLLYGEESQFQIESAPGEGTSISFRIPVMLEI